ncbi:unnamed protein product [Bemisia tabaci]|uniref:RNA-directed DNA polymerase n=1 Tax=Bemisia tabaci TaxID=7038 RepID=A0A9N9ZW28_BEMTA|nr:unnamed protein product [Bemisia tabaci]
MNEEQFTAFLNVVQASLSSISIQAPAIPGAAAGQSNGESNPDGSSSTSSSTWRILNFEQYDGKEKFCQYVERFENFAGLRGISNDSLLMKSTLINCLGSETYQLLKAISAPKELKDLSYKDIIASLSQHLSPPPNKLLEQHRFLSRLQKDTETIGEYVAALRSFLENSEFKCTCGKSIADMFLRAQFIRGIKSSFIRERLLCESELTFERAVNMALSLESSKLDNQEILNGSASTTGVTSVCKIHSSKPSSSHNSRYRSRNKSEQRYQRSDSRHSKRGKSAKRRIDYEKLGISDLCISCGRNNHRAFDCKVNPSSLKCFSCSKTGHISKVCISTLLTQNRSHKVNAVNDEYPDVNDIVDFSSNPDCFLLSSDPFYSEDDDTGKYIASVDINGFETQFEVDSGCGYTLLPENQFLKLDPRIKLFPARQNFKSYDHGIIKPIGYAKAAVTFNNITAYVPFYVVPSKFSAILGRSWIRRFQINLNELSTQKPSSKEDFSSVHRITIQDIQQQFPDICVQKVGKIPDLKCSLPLKSNAKPKFQKPRDPPYAFKKPVDNELDDLERDDIITRTDTSDWGSPLVPVPKTVEKVRLCVDYKSGVNPQLEDFHYPIPRIEELMSELKESSVYCKIDLYKAYLHVEMDDEAKKIQAISTHRGTYLMNRLSLGIKTAPSQFHQILGRLLAGLSGRNLQGNQPLLDFELSACHENTLNQISSANVTSYDIAEAAESDPKLVDIISKLRSSSEDPACMEYVLEGDIVYRGNRVYIPQSLRGQILKELHETHSGITKTKQLARRYVYWPSIDSDIEKLIKSCEQCMLSQKSPKKVPTHKWEEPTQNFSRVHMDYAGPRKGFNFLILVDAKSKWPEVRILSKAPTTDSTIKLLEDIFSFHGYPQTLVSDNASIFSADNAEFNNYCKTKGIFHCFTAPGKPATNGLAERYVQILKSKLSKMEAEPGDIQEKVRQIVLRFRATPLLDGSSPAERYLGRRIKLRLDAIHPFKPLKNSSCQATHLRSFQIGDKIIARVYRSNKPSWQPGLVRKKFGKIHYLVELSNGYTLKRHIDQLRDASFLDFKTPEHQQSKPKKQVSFQVQMPTPRDIPDLHVVPSGRQVVIPVAKPASPGSPSASRKPPTVQGSSSHLVRQPLPLTSHGSLPSPVSLPSTSQSANQDVPPPVIDLTSQTPRKLPSVGRGRATIRSPVLDRPSRIKKVPGYLKDFVPK